MSKYYKRIVVVYTDGTTETYSHPNQIPKLHNPKEDFSELDNVAKYEWTTTTQAEEQEARRLAGFQGTGYTVDYDPDTGEEC